ncbi:MAG TPA: S9 family peptidase [Gemmatimonadaceae bacterium]|nr:S9 family peptidase [Gemmatimonadaceae bacterium]
MIRRFLLLACLATTPLVAQSGARTPAIDSLLSLKSVGSPRISPDGQRIAYLVTSTDWQQDAFVSQLWLHDVSSGNAQQLTRHELGVSQVQWSPDGRWISFISTRVEQRPQLFALPVAGGESVRLTSAAGGVASYAWRRDAGAIAFTSSSGAAARKARDTTLGGYEVVRRDYAMQQLYTLDVAAAMSAPQPGAMRTPAGAKYSVGAFEWSPDGRHIAFSATSVPDLAVGNTADIHVLTLADDAVRTLVMQPGADNDPHWSPDGRQIVFSSAMGNVRTNFFRNARLAIVDAAGGVPHAVTMQFDEQPNFVDWGTRGIYFSGAQRTASHLFVADPASGAIARVTAPDSAIVSGFSLTRDQSAAAFVIATPTTLPEIATSPLTTFAPRVLTSLTAQVRDWRLGTREVIRWKSRDGAEIEGILIKPRDFDPSRRYPLLCVIHGGPTGTDRPTLPDARYYPIDEWVNRGALVLKVNYRGSAGYGEKFRGLNYRNLGVGDAWDVVSGVDALVAKGWVDASKVASMGWSQGGYISAFLTTSSTRFAATSVGAGISDWRTYYYNTDITPFTVNYLGADPVADPAIYARTSPVDYVKGARTPTLIQHGELDRRVPIANAYQLRQALEDRGVPVEMIVYKGYGHGITKPKSQRAVMQHNLAWFNHYIFGDPLPDLTRAASLAPTP